MGFLDKITGNEEVWMVHHGVVSRGNMRLAKEQYCEMYLTEADAYEGMAQSMDQLAARYEMDMHRCRQDATVARQKAAACKIASKK